MDPLLKNSLHSPVYGFKSKLVRLSWFLIYKIFFRWSPIQMFRWRVLLLRFFGADVCFTARIYPSAKIWLPSNLSVSANATIGPYVNVYNQGQISIARACIISQGAHLCASTHDYNDPLHPLVLAPIVLGQNVWVCSDAFIGPGITVADGAVIGARAVVSKNPEAWCVYAGNPAVKLKERKRFTDV